MKSITIHNMNEILSSKIEILSREMGLSKNKLIKVLLSKALGLDQNKKAQIDLSMVASSMSAEEAATILNANSAFDEIEAAEWL